jgi:hypothetical protein
MRRRISLLCMRLLIGLALSGCGRAPAAGAPAPTPEPSWKPIDGGGATLWLPATYQTLDLDAGVDQRIAKLKQFGGKYAQTARMTARSRAAFALWAFDSHAGYYSCAATVGVLRTRPVSAALTLDLFAAEVIRQLPALAGDAQAQLVGQERLSLNAEPAMRMFLEFPGACRKEVLYTLKRGDRFWLIVFAADLQEFERRLPSFEHSIGTFSVDT